MTFRFSKQRRRQQLKAKPFPAARRLIITRNVPIFMRLPHPDQIELLGHVQVFLAEKKTTVIIDVGDRIHIMDAAQISKVALLRRPPAESADKTH